MHTHTHTASLLGLGPKTGFSFTVTVHFTSPVCTTLLLFNSRMLHILKLAFHHPCSFTSCFPLHLCIPHLFCCLVHLFNASSVIIATNWITESLITHHPAATAKYHQVTSLVRVRALSILICGMWLFWAQTLLVRKSLEGRLLKQAG